jgi:hypothetical protein
LFPGRREGRIEFVLRDGVNPSVEPSGKSSLICTPRKTNFDPLEVCKAFISARDQFAIVATKKKGPEGP